MATPLTVEELRPRMENLTIIDVRSPAEYVAGHIPGAYNVPLDELDRALPALRSAAEQGELAVVCASGPRSQNACERLVAAGISATILAGGTNAWASKGEPIERAEGARAVWAMDRQVRMVAGSLVVLGLIADLIVPGARWFSAAIGGGLIFSAVSNTCAMASLLAKLPFNRPRTPAPALEDTLADLSR